MVTVKVHTVPGVAAAAAPKIKVVKLWPPPCQKRWCQGAVASAAVAPPPPALHVIPFLYFSRRVHPRTVFAHAACGCLRGVRPDWRFADLVQPSDPPAAEGDADASGRSVISTLPASASCPGSGLATAACFSRILDLPLRCELALAASRGVPICVRCPRENGDSDKTFQAPSIFVLLFSMMFPYAFSRVSCVAIRTRLVHDKYTAKPCKKRRG